MVSPDQLVAEALALFRRLQNEYVGLQHSQGCDDRVRRLGRIKYRVYKRLRRRQQGM